MHQDFARVLNAAKLKLEAFQVKEGERLAILASSATLPVLLDAYYAAAVVLGAEPVLLMYKAREHMSELPPFIVTMLGEVDAVADLHSLTWSYSQALTEFHKMIKARKIRYRAMHLMGNQQAELSQLIHCPPDKEIIERTLRAQKMIDAAKTVRVTSGLGTDLTVTRGNRPSVAPMGEVAFFPPEEGSNGLIRFIGGVQSIGPTVFTRMIYAPVNLKIERGRIVDVSGDTPDAPMLDMWFRSIRDPNIYQFAHVNLGVDQRMLVYNRDDFSIHVNYGGVSFGIGANASPGIGGDVLAKGHVEMLLIEADFWIDDTRVLEAGEFTVESRLRAPGR
jgi:2,5-dihydroxypyridine 5,6-dioxygenase